MSENEESAEARRWLRYALEDLEAGEALLSQRTAIPRHICWLAQQSAEKAIKAALIFLQIDFPHRHDLDVLRNLLPASWSIKEQQPDLAELTEWSVEARYPGDWPEATDNDARIAMQQARAVWQSIETDLLHNGFP